MEGRDIPHGGGVFKVDIGVFVDTVAPVSQAPSARKDYKLWSKAGTVFGEVFEVGIGGIGAPGVHVD